MSETITAISSELTLEDGTTNRIMAAFGPADRDVILNANDQFKASGVSRKEFVRALETLTDTTCELTLLEKDVDYDEETGQESYLYLRPASRLIREAVGSQS